MSVVVPLTRPTAPFSVGVSGGRHLPGGGRVDVETVGHDRATVRVAGAVRRGDQHTLVDLFTELVLFDVRAVAVDLVGVTDLDAAAADAIERARAAFHREGRSFVVVDAVRS